MRYDLIEIEQLPEVLSLADLCRVCHLSKLDARYYLKSGLIPCETTGKKTRCYLVKKTALLRVLRDYSENPKKYTVPRIWREKGELYHVNVNPTIYLPTQYLTSDIAIEYYRKKLADMSELVCVSDVARITGYNSQTVTYWCRRKRIVPHARTTRFWISQQEVLRFLTSFDYNDIKEKSEVHIADIRAIYNLIHDRKEAEK